MKRIILVVLMVAVLLLAASAKDKRMTGWLTDASCASKPEATSPEHEECAKKCAAGGQMVFVAEADRKVWSIANPGMLKGLEGQRVALIGDTDTGKATIRVRSVMQ